MASANHVTLTSNPQITDSKTLDNQQPSNSIDVSINTRDREETESVKVDSDQSKEEKVEGEEEEEEEGEGECGFCLFMKGGGCKDTFIAWENCIEETEKKNEDIVVKCMEVTSALKKCMEANADYYDPILRAEKAAAEEVATELEKEKQEAEDGEESTQKSESKESEKKAV